MLSYSTMALQMVIRPPNFLSKLYHRTKYEAQVVRPKLLRTNFSDVFVPRTTVHTLAFLLANSVIIWPANFIKLFDLQWLNLDFLPRLTLDLNYLYERNNDLALIYMGGIKAQIIIYFITSLLIVPIYLSSKKIFFIRKSYKFEIICAVLLYLSLLFLADQFWFGSDYWPVPGLHSWFEFNPESISRKSLRRPASRLVFLHTALGVFFVYCFWLWSIRHLALAFKGRQITIEQLGLSEAKP